MTDTFTAHIVGWHGRAQEYAVTAVGDVASDLGGVYVVDGAAYRKGQVFVNIGEANLMRALLQFRVTVGLAWPI